MFAWDILQIQLSSVFPPEARIWGVGEGVSKRKGRICIINIQMLGDVFEFPTRLLLFSLPLLQQMSEAEGSFGLKLVVVLSGKWPGLRHTLPRALQFGGG